MSNFIELFKEFFFFKLLPYGKSVKKYFLSLIVSQIKKLIHIFLKDFMKVPEIKFICPYIVRFFQYHLTILVLFGQYILKRILKIIAIINAETVTSINLLLVEIYIEKLSRFIDMEEYELLAISNRLSLHYYE